MFKIILPFYLILGFTFNSFCQVITFSDPAFEKAVLDNDSIIDANLDGKIQVSEANGVKKMELTHKDINSIEDIYYFPNIEYLNVNYNNLEEVTLDGLKKLREFHCSFNKIGSITIQNLPSLTDIGFSRNNVKSPKLLNLPNLESYYAFENQMETIDLSTFNKLKYLNLNDNKLSSIDISKNLELIQIQLQRNPLKEIDIRKNKKLEVHIMYIDDSVKIIGNEDPKPHTNLIITESAPEEDISNFNRDETIDSLVVQCKYSVMFEIFKNEIVDKYALEKKWDEKRKAKVSSIIKFEEISAYIYYRQYRYHASSEIMKIIKDCQSFNESQVPDHFSVYLMPILLEYEKYISSICEMN